jgi:hypothetical protein
MVRGSFKRGLGCKELELTKCILRSLQGNKLFNADFRYNIILVFLIISVSIIKDNMSQEDQNQMLISELLSGNDTLRSEAIVKDKRIVQLEAENKSLDDEVKLL